MNSTHNILALLAILLTCGSCAAPRVAQDYQRDSVFVHIHDSVTVRDTVVMVQLPDESDRAVLPDSDTSRLRTSLAESEAYVKDGRLHHTLHNRSERTLPVSVQYYDRVRSEKSGQSIIRKETVEVPRDFTRWQRFLMGLGWALIAAAILWLVYKALKIFRVLR